MNPGPRFLTLPILACALSLMPAAAHAAALTLGSDLTASATVSEAQGADTAFWPASVGGQDFTVPADGQIVQVKVKGTTLSDHGKDPTTQFHLQSLEPASSDGSRKVYLTSQRLDMPVDKPDAITTFLPQSLCVHKGGSVDLNEIGGFQWAGPNTFPQGTPYQIFAAVRSSVTNTYTAADKTNNGDTLTPRPLQGEELLMQVVLLTGDDRSQACGGPAPGSSPSHVTSGGSSKPAPKPIPLMSVRDQRLYVSTRGAVSPLAFCPGRGPTCSGTATLAYKGKVIATSRFSSPAGRTAHMPMKITAAMYRAVKRAKVHGLRVTLTVVTARKTYVQPITIRH